MNDQRQVIFSQRLKILKNTNIDEILDDFLQEISNKLENIKNLYQTSNDKKVYLASIKNAMGNAFGDEELLAMAKLSQQQFAEKIKKTYVIKKK